MYRLILLPLITLFLFSCAQNTQSTQPQDLQQPTELLQDAASQGRGGDITNTFNFYTYGAPTTQPASASGLDTENTDLVFGSGGAIIALSFNNQSGGTSTPSQTGTNTAGSASLTGNPTLSPTQRPQAQVDPAVAIGPTPIANTTTGGMDNSPATSTTTPTINYSQLIEQAKAGSPAAIEFLANLAAKNDLKAIEAINSLK